MPEGEECAESPLLQASMGMLMLGVLKLKEEDIMIAIDKPDMKAKCKTTHKLELHIPSKPDG